MSNEYQLVEINRENVYSLIELQVRLEEASVIAPNPNWIAEALLFNEAITFGIFESEMAVGLLTLIDPREALNQDPDYEFANRSLYVWRLMVDRNQRNKGIGKYAIGYSIDYAAEIGLDGVMLATDETNKYSAAEFYEKLGFKRTGRIIEGETEFEYFGATNTTKMK